MIMATILVQLASAQQPPTPPQAPSASHSSYQQKISINEKKDKKMKLVVNDDQFKLNLVFPKRYIKEVQKKFKAHFNSSESDKFEWAEIDENGLVELHKNKLKIFYKKEQVSEEGFKSIKAFTEDTLSFLDWDAEEMGLWKYEGNWSLNN